MGDPYFGKHPRAEVRGLEGLGMFDSVEAKETPTGAAPGRAVELLPEVARELPGHAFRQAVEPGLVIGVASGLRLPADDDVTGSLMR